MKRIFVLAVALTFYALPVEAQWTNRYQQLDGYRHHVYLEGFELPTMNAGPTAPAVSPDGTEVAFSARGWIWILDLESGRARRLTDGAEMDFRPAWSPAGTAASSPCSDRPPSSRPWVRWSSTVRSTGSRSGRRAVCSSTRSSPWSGSWRPT